ncbi:MAG: HEAT repeat domain-containing protein [Methylococcaceae bacterium]
MTQINRYENQATGSRYLLNKLFNMTIACLILGNSAASLAAENSVGNDKKGVQIMMTRNKGSELQLEARQVALSEVLNKIVAKTGVRIHYSVLPEGLITATCVGATIKQVLECLFDRKADLIFSYPHLASQDNDQSKPEEIWVLGTNFSSEKIGSSGNCSVAGTQEAVLQSDQIMTNAELPQIKPEDTGKLIEMTQAKDPSDRADAIARLGTQGEEGNTAVRQTLAAALADKDAAVRAQAVNSLARREGDGATKELQEALQDSDTSVRLMVVDNAGSNSALLQQALSDSDETVRTVAAMKLDALSKAEITH